MLLVYFNGFLKYRSVLMEFVERDIKTRYRRSILGLLWTVLNPLLTMIVMTIVFSTVFQSNIQNFPVYMLSGLTIFNFFSESTSNAMRSVIDGSSLIKKIYIPKYLFPLSKVLSTLVNLVASFVALFCVMMATGVKITPVVFLFVIPVIYAFIFALGMGLVLSSIAVFFRDTIHFYGVLLTMWMYLTPLFYPVDILPDIPRKIVQMNPLTNIIEYIRIITLYGEVPSFILNVKCFVPGIAVLAIGLWIFRNTQDQFILHI